MNQHTYTIAHIFCGLGGSAIGASAAVARFGEHEARFRNLGGVDFNADACTDFEALTGAPAMVRDLHEMQPAELRLLLGERRPDVVMMSPPCKGFSRLIASAKAAQPKYQKMNRLLVDALFLICSTWDTPPPLIFVENVPGIRHRGQHILDQVFQVLQAHGYRVTDGNHDCGELGNLAQRRKRYFLLARQPEAVPHMVYHPAKRPVRACGEVLGPLPMPGDTEGGGPMHSVPGLSWLNWCRLALIPPGGDWRDLPGVLADDQARREVHRRHPVEAWDGPVDTVTAERGNAAKSVADPRVPASWWSGCMGVAEWSDPTGTVTGNARPTTGRFTVADPRPFGNRERVTGWDAPVGTVTSKVTPASGGPAVADPRFGHVDRVTPWSEPVGTITRSPAPSSGAAAVADPRFGRRKGSLGVQSFDAPARTVTGADPTSQGGAIVADPRIALGDNPNRHRNKYAVKGWDEPAPTVMGATRPGSGAPSVADPRFADGKRKNWQQVAGVTPWDEPGPTVTAGAKIHAGAFQVADPRVAETDIRFRGAPRNGQYRVLHWSEVAPCVTGNRRTDNGAGVADPRIAALRPDRAPPWIPIIIADDGTWHRPLTTYELAALQGFPLEVNGKPLVLHGTSHTAWRERIGNAVPPPAAQAVAEQLLQALLLSELGTYTIGSTGIWVEEQRPAAAEVLQ